MGKIRKSFEVTKTLKEDFIKLCDKNDVKPTNVLSLELEKILQDESLEFNLIEKFCKEFNNIILDLKRSFVGVDLYFNLNVYDKEGNMIFDEDESTLKDTDFAERFKREVLYYQMKH